MKFTVIEPGLRPVIAIVYYPVVDGKPGRRVEVPLSVMVHNNEPYRVAVDVKGRRVVASIEGQDVESFTDAGLSRGGIGFFSEPGERSRLYWMSVSVNNDFLGKVFAYVSETIGQNQAAVAALGPPAPPAGGPDSGGDTGPCERAILAAGVFPYRRNWRNRKWTR